ncbi:MAG TPA: hypothetical protein VFD70_19240 [Anaerolineae bacterium]|nr:hypothetical protein [Anaerolineae bacterium]
MLNPKWLFTIGAVLFGLGGLGSLLIPSSAWMSGGTAPLDFIQLGRAFGAWMFGFAVVLAVARNAAASKARDAIFVGGFVANVLDGIGNVIGILAGYAVVVSAVILVINILFAVAFFVVGRANWSSVASGA